VCTILINQSIYIAQRHNVSNALKRRVNTERIKRFKITFENINGKGGISNNFRVYTVVMGIHVIVSLQLS